MIEVRRSFMKKKNLPVTNIGTVSLMMMFIVLCMVTFAALSLTSASHDARLGQKLADRQTEFYHASNQAEEMLAKVDDIIASAYKTTTDETAYYRTINKDLLLCSAEAVWTDQELDVMFQVPVNDFQTIQVLLDVPSPQQIKSEQPGSFYKILSWKILYTKAWKSDDTIQLIQ